MQTAFNDWSREKQLDMELATATASIMQENEEHQKDKISNVSIRGNLIVDT